MTVAAVAISLVVAVAENGVIGREGGLPWRMPSDLKTFRNMTMGKPLIMGRRTLQAIGKPLDGRDNIVVTRDATFAMPGTIVVGSIDAALAEARRCAAARGADEIMVIGGADIYRQTMPVADRIYLTRIHARPEGDATFAEPEPEQWRLTERRPIAPHPRDDHTATLLVFERIR